MNKKSICLFLSLILIIFSFGGCKNSSKELPPVSSSEEVLTSNQTKDISNDIINNYSSEFDENSKKFLSLEFLEFFSTKFGLETLSSLHSSLANKTFQNDWHSICGYSAFSLNDLFFGNNFNEINNETGSTVINMVGDICLADNWKIAPIIDQNKNGMSGVMDKNTIDILKSSDLTVATNEFTISDRGTPLDGKTYTFRASPSRTSLYHEIGVDLVTLANNHCFDYGSDAFDDTMASLKENGIKYFGAGSNKEEASEVVYYIVNGYKIGFVAATNAEKLVLTPEAGENSAGVLRMYDPTELISIVKEADKQCDYLISYLHWGTEYTCFFEEKQTTIGKQLIDSGVDIVVGSHAHVIQGIEFYKGKPIVYNLGNFLFNSKTLDSCILEIKLNEKCVPSFKMIPCIQKECNVNVVNGEEKTRIISFFEFLSKNTDITKDGCFSEKVS